jgi:hypothetical protein
MKCRFSTPVSSSANFRLPVCLVSSSGWLRISPPDATACLNICSKDALQSTVSKSALICGLSTTTAGLSSSFPWLPSTWSALIASSSLPQKAATASRNYRSWPVPSRPIWQPLCHPSPPASGITTLSVPPVACAACWLASLSQTCQPLCQGEFEKRRWFLAICPRVFWVIAVQNRPLRPNWAQNELFPKIFKVLHTPNPLRSGLSFE